MWTKTRPLATALLVSFRSPNFHKPQSDTLESVFLYSNRCSRRLSSWIHTSCLNTGRLHVNHHQLQFSNVSKLKLSTAVVNYSQQQPEPEKDKPKPLRYSSRQVSEFDETEEDTSKPYIVYDGSLKRQMKHVKIFSLTTSAMGLFMQPTIYKNAGEHGMAATIAMLGMVGFFTYVTPFLIHILAKKYITEIVYDPQTQLYTASTYTFFLRRRETVFRRDDVTVPNVPGPFTAIVINTKEGKKPFFIAIESFKYPNHFGLMMGYDKPIDLHLSDADFKQALEKKKQEIRDKAKVDNKQ